MDKLTKDQKRKFPPLCPDFVVELTSPTDRLKQVKLKMREWMDNGVQLGWLIDADRKTAYIYRRGQKAEDLDHPKRLNGEGPVDGFSLDLTEIWAGL